MSQKLKPKVEALGKKLERELASNPEAAKNYAGAVTGLLERIDQRYASLKEQVKEEEAEPVKFDGDKALALTEWRPAQETERIQLDKKQVDGVEMMRISCPKGEAEVLEGGWRTNLLLGKGRYAMTVKHSK